MYSVGWLRILVCFAGLDELLPILSSIVGIFTYSILQEFTFHVQILP